MRTLLKLSDELFLGNAAILEIFHQFYGLNVVTSCLHHMSKMLSLDLVCVFQTTE